MYGRLQRRFNQSVHTDRLFILLSHVCFRQLQTTGRGHCSSKCWDDSSCVRAVLLTPLAPSPTIPHLPSPPRDLSQMWIVHVWCSASVCINDLRLHNCQWYIWQPSRKFKAGANSKAVDGVFFFFFSMHSTHPAFHFRAPGCGGMRSARLSASSAQSQPPDLRRALLSARAPPRCRHEW